MKDFVSIIILQYNGIDLLDRCLKSLAKTKYSNYEIIVVDNKSIDNSVDFVKKNYPKVKLIENNKNYGFAEGNNIGIKHAKGDYIVFLNNDIEVNPEWLEELIKGIREDNVVACQPKVLSLKGKNKFEYAGAGGGFIDKYGYPICRGRVYDIIEEDNGQYDDGIDVFWVCGVCMCVKKDVFVTAGCFDKDFFVYGEEIDLCWRLNLLGYKLKYVPKSVIYHLGRGTAGKKIKTWYWLHRNHSILLLKNYSLKNLIKILPIKVLLEIMAFFAFLFKDYKRSVGIFCGWSWILFHPFNILKRHNKIQKMRKISDEKIIKRMLKGSTAINYFIKRKKFFPEFLY